MMQNTAVATTTLSVKCTADARTRWRRPKPRFAAGTLSGSGERVCGSLMRTKYKRKRAAEATRSGHAIRRLGRERAANGRQVLGQDGRAREAIPRLDRARRHDRG